MYPRAPVISLRSAGQRRITHHRARGPLNWLAPSIMTKPSRSATQSPPKGRQADRSSNALDGAMRGGPDQAVEVDGHAPSHRPSSQQTQDVRHDQRSKQRRRHGQLWKWTIPIVATCEQLGEDFAGHRHRQDEGAQHAIGRLGAGYPPTKDALRRPVVEQLEVLRPGDVVRGENSQPTSGRGTVQCDLRVNPCLRRDVDGIDHQVARLEKAIDRVGLDAAFIDAQRGEGIYRQDARPSGVSLVAAHVGEGGVLAVQIADVVAARIEQEKPLRARSDQRHDARAPGRTTARNYDARPSERRLLGLADETAITRDQLGIEGLVLARHHDVMAASAGAPYRLDVAVSKSSCRWCQKSSKCSRLVAINRSGVAASTLAMDPSISSCGTNTTSGPSPARWERPAGE